jgi:endonuclease YncB( thermonuclease family)
MTVAPVLRGLLVTTALLCPQLVAGAATLQAKVVEVQSGNVLVVKNIDRALSIKLKAIAPPEGGQPFSDTAREHLKALVLDKPVAVEYTHLVDGYLLAKITRDGIDIGSQMLRDGVAWYDRASDYELSAGDRDLYAQCEQAARNERRGLWQDEAPVSPWEFRRAQLARLDSIMNSASPRQSQPRTPRANRTSLSNDDLLSAMVGPGSIAGGPSFKPIATNSAPGRWTRFESPAEHFSVLVPSDGIEATYSVLDSEGKAVPFHYLIGSNGPTLYMLMSTRAPNGKYTDASAAEDAIKGFVGAINRSIEQTGLNAPATARRVRDFRLNGYAGRQYSLSSQLFSGVARVFSKQVGEQRELFMLCVLNRPGTESSGDQFLNSFKISGN